MNGQFQHLNATSVFSAPIYQIDKPEFLEITKKISNKFINQRKEQSELNPNYPVYMTENINYDPEMLEFANFVAQTAWNILDLQGYAMNEFTTYFKEMWAQEHHTMSSMERHIHGNGSVMTGFYFLDVPKDSSRVLFYDPRDSKVITNLPEKDISEITHASNIINFEPTEGALFFTNSWLPHSFTKNLSKEPIRFIHFNIGVMPLKQNNVEII